MRLHPNGSAASAAALLLTLSVSLDGHHATAGARQQPSTRPVSAPSTLLLTNAWLIDGTGASALENAWIRIDGDRIAAIGQGTPPVVPHARRLDLAGRTVVPGLADMHVHLGAVGQARWMLKLLLAHGVTRVKDTGARLGNLEALRLWLASEAVVPRVYLSGVTINGSFPDLQFLDSGPRTRAMLENNHAFGVQFLKAYNWDSSRALAQMGEFARTHSLTLTGHVPLGMTSVAAIDAGMQILEHVRLRPFEALDDPEIIARYPLDLSVTRREAFWAYFDPKGDAIRRTLDAWARRKDRFFSDPTIVAQWGISHADGAAEAALGPAVVRLVSDALLKRWRDSGSGRQGESENPLTPAEYAEAKRATEGWIAFTGLAQSRGIRILSGTDTPVNWVVPGHSLHQELEFFVKAGMSPVEAVRCSTGRAAEAFRTPNIGTIAAGHAADLVIVRGNVAADIGNIRNVEKVILGGQVHDRAVLLEDARRHAARDARTSNEP